MNLNPDQADHLHHQISNVHATCPKDWGDFSATAMALPAWLRENGLQQTLRFLSLQATDKLGVRRLLHSWLGNGSACLVTLAAMRRGGVTGNRHHPLYTLTSQIALAEAQRIKRSVEALDQMQPAQAAARSATDSTWECQPDTHEPDLIETELPSEHPGMVWRFSAVPRNVASALVRSSYKAAHVKRVCLASAPSVPLSAYGQFCKHAFERWDAWVSTKSQTQLVKVENRLLIGMGGASINETQVLLNPVHGMPYLPGSTLKGALRSWLVAHIEAMPDDQQVYADALRSQLDPLFGSAHDDLFGQGGLLIVHDAWYKPDGLPPLLRETETPHHSAYHSGKQAAPTAFDSPIPVAQIAVQGSFLLAVSHANVGEAWAKQALDWLGQALRDPVRGGLGGKAFSGGYGRLIGAAAPAATVAAGPAAGPQTGNTITPKKKKRPPQA